MVGKEHGATLCMMRNLEIERVGLAAMSVGIARRYDRPIHLLSLSASFEDNS